LLKDVYTTVFESFLCEIVSSDPEKLDKYRASITEARRTNKPLLYFFTDTRPTSGEMPINQQTKLLMEEFVVINASIEEAPAISQITNLPTPSRNIRYTDTVIVLTHPDGTEIEVPRVEYLHGKDAPDLTLAQALVKYYETHLPKPSELPRIHRLILSIDQTLAAKLKELEAKTHPQPENPEDDRKTDRIPDNDGNLARTF